MTQQSAQALKDEIDMPEMPDIEHNEGGYDVVYFEAKPGDVIIHHLRTIHGAAGNVSSKSHLRAASIRYIGDDVTYRKGTLMMGTSALITPSKQSADGEHQTIWAAGDPNSANPALPHHSRAKAMDEGFNKMMKPGSPPEGVLCWPKKGAKL